MVVHWKGRDVTSLWDMVASWKMLNHLKLRQKGYMCFYKSSHSLRAWCCFCLLYSHTVWKLIVCTSRSCKAISDSINEKENACMLASCHKRLTMTTFQACFDSDFWPDEGCRYCNFWKYLYSILPRDSENENEWPESKTQILLTLCCGIVSFSTQNQTVGYSVCMTVYD